MAKRHHHQRAHCLMSESLLPDHHLLLPDEHHLMTWTWIMKGRDPMKLLTASLSLHRRRGALMIMKSLLMMALVSPLAMMKIRSLMTMMTVKKRRSQRSVRAGSLGSHPTSSQDISRSNVVTIQCTVENCYGL